MRHLALVIAVSVLCSGVSAFAQIRRGSAKAGRSVTRARSGAGSIGRGQSVSVAQRGHGSHFRGHGRFSHHKHFGHHRHGHHHHKHRGFHGHLHSGKVGLYWSLGTPFYGSYYRSSWFSPSYFYSGCFPSYYPTTYYVPQVVTKPVYVPVERPSPAVDADEIRDAVRDGVRDAIRDALKERELKGDVLDGAVEIEPGRRPAPRLVKRVHHPSTKKDRAQSVKYQAAGDEALQAQNTLQAFVRYEQAIDAAEDRAEPHFRQAFNLIAMRKFDRAVDEIRIGLALDPEWPLTGESLDEIYGTESKVAKQSYLHNLSSWAYEDVRDPRRLFLLGVFLHFDGQDGKSALLFETASRLSEDAAHVALFQREPEAEKGVSSVPAARTARRERQPAVSDRATDAPAPSPPDVRESELPPLPIPLDEAPPAPQPPE